MLWNTFSQLDRLRQEMDSLFNECAYGTASGSDFPPVNIYNSEDDMVFSLEVPGINLDDLEITSKQNTITIKGERKAEELKDGQYYLRRERGNGRFTRSFTVPFDIDADKIEAHYNSGILMLKVPRAESAKPKRIAVNVA